MYLPFYPWPGQLQYGRPLRDNDHMCSEGLFSTLGFQAGKLMSPGDSIGTESIGFGEQGGPGGIREERGVLLIFGYSE